MNEVLEFDQMEIHLAELYCAGQPTPLIGLGTSLPTRTTCKAFLSQLGFQSHLDIILPVFGNASKSKPGTKKCHRLAETLTMLLKSRQQGGRNDANRAALRATATAMVPRQTVQWPLVLTTNYDDLY